MLHKKLVREVNALVIRCPQKELGCEWEGELGQLQGHLNPGAGVSSSSEECAYVMVSCAYQCGAQLQRRLLREHEMGSCPKQAVGIQITEIMHRMKDIIAENKLLQQELSVIKNTVGVIKEAHKKEIEDLNHSHENDQHKAKEEINKLRGQIDEMKRTCQKKNDSKRMQADVMRRLVALEEECASLRTHTVPLPLPPFYALMRNVDHYLEGEYIYNSDPFYSHPGGYKMNIVAYPNGSVQSRATRLSVGITILRGEFDDQLKWPFNGEVMIQAYNRTQRRWSAELTMVLNKRVCGLEVIKKRVDSLSYAHYTDEFLLCSKLEADYLHGTNMIRFRVTNVKIFNHP
jgi:TNF receptor-associated factor 4